MTIPELSLDEAWEMLASDPRSVLIDVRTEAEWAFVGVPDLDELGKQVRLVEWTMFPGGRANDSFVTQASEGLELDQPILLLCRSGARSLAAAGALRNVGFSATYNVVDGFEGDLDQRNHRRGGWKDHLPWRQG